MPNTDLISRQKYQLIQLIASVIMVVIWFFSNQGLLFWDDFTYLNFANQINQGDFEITTNHFTSRIALIYPVSWAIDAFGIGPYAIVIFHLLCSLTLLNLTFWLGQKISLWTGLIAGTLILCDYNLIFFGNHLFPEVPLTLCVFLFLMSYYLLLRNEIVPRIAAFIGALALFAAFLLKTTIILILPLVLFLFINDRRQRRNKAFWIVFIFLSFFFFVLNGLWYEEVKGDFFFRFKNIANNHVATPKTFFDKGGIEILKRLTYLPILGFLKGGFFIPLVLALPSILSLKRSNFRLEKPEQLWPVAASFLLLSFWFMSTSWRFYSPIPTENRHIVFFIPVFIISAALYWPQRPSFEWLSKNHVMKVALVGFLLIPIYAIFKSGDNNFKDMSSLIKSELVDNQSAQLVITDGLTTYGYPYYYDMAQAEDVYLWFSESETFEILTSFDDSAYLLVNTANFNEDYKDSENYNKFIEQLQENNINIGLLKKEGDVELYLLTK
jgi:hypothetical protein